MWRTKSYQLFAKSLPVSKSTREQIYKSGIDLETFLDTELCEIKDLDPSLVLNKESLELLNKFGIDKIKTLKGMHLSDFHMELLEKIDPNVENLKEALDEKIANRKRLFFELDDNMSSEEYNIKYKYNNDSLFITDIIKNYEMFENINLEDFLSKRYSISENDFRNFVSNNRTLSNILAKYIGDSNYIELVNIIIEKDENARERLIQLSLQQILQNSVYEGKVFTKQEYEETFKYIPMSTFFNVNLNDDNLPEEVKKIIMTLPDDRKIDVIPLYIISKKQDDFPYDFLLDFGFEQLLDYYEKNFSSEYDFGRFVSLLEYNIRQRFQGDIDRICKYSFDDKKQLIDFVLQYTRYLDRIDGIDGRLFYNLDINDASKISSYISMVNELIYNKIINNGISFKNAPKQFFEKYPTTILKENNGELDDITYEELKNRFYSRNIDVEFLLSNPKIIDFLKGVELELMFKAIVVSTPESNNINIITLIKEKKGYDKAFEFMIQYGKYLEKLKSTIELDSVSNIDEIINIIEHKIYEEIVNRKIEYSDDLPENFKKKYPNLFLNGDTNYMFQFDYLKRKIYQGICSAEDLIMHPEYLDKIKNIKLELLFKPHKLIIQTRNGVINENIVSYLEKQFGYEDAFKVLLLYGRIIDQLGYRDIKFKKHPFTLNDFLDELDIFIHGQLVDSKLQHNENYPEHFKNNYPDIFIKNSNCPEEIKTKYYNGDFTEEDLKNPLILELLGNAKIGFGFSNPLIRKLSVVLPNETWLFLLSNVDLEKLLSDSDYINYLFNQHQQLSISELKKITENYIMNYSSKYYLMNLFEDGYDKYIDDIKIRFKRLKTERPELDTDNPEFCLNLFSKEIVSLYGYDFISMLLEFNTTAASIIISESKKGDSLMKQWIDIVKKIPYCNERLIHKAIMNYNELKTLVEDIVNNDIELTEDDLEVMYILIVQNNKYGAKEYSNIKNFKDFRRDSVSKSINNDRDAFLEILFGTNMEETKRIFKEYGLFSPLYIEVLVEDGVIDETEKFALIFANDILNNIISTSLLRQMNENNELVPSVFGLKSIEIKINEYINNKFKEKLKNDFNKERQGISYRTIKGSSIDTPDINGEIMSFYDSIDVIELNGVDFNLLIHSLRGFDCNHSEMANEMKDNPGIWNTKEGASTISTSLISDQRIGYVTGPQNEHDVYYGFENITERSILLMGPLDLYVSHGSRVLEPISGRNANTFTHPDTLQFLSFLICGEGPGRWNEVLLDRKSSDSKAFDHRIQPTYIVCFDGKINEESKMAAQYFRVPIVVINTQAYKDNREKQYESYLSGDVSNLSIEDCRKILYSTSNISTNYNLFLSILDKSLKNGTISSDLYIEMLLEGRRLIAYYSIKGNIENIDINEINIRIETVKEGNYKYGTKGL